MGFPALFIAACVLPLVPLFFLRQTASFHLAVALALFSSALCLGFPRWLKRPGGGSVFSWLYGIGAHVLTIGTGLVILNIPFAEIGTHLCHLAFTAGLVLDWRDIPSQSGFLSNQPLYQRIRKK
jgi:hypothetical protein